jgi:hypothetical protein
LSIGNAHLTSSIAPEHDLAMAALIVRRVAV